MLVDPDREAHPIFPSHRRPRPEAVPHGAAPHGEPHRGWCTGPHPLATPRSGLIHQSRRARLKPARRPSKPPDRRTSRD
jgi:hypothetical protein